MITVSDFSKHRGGILRLLPDVYAMFKENAQADRAGVLRMPGHFVTWQQDFKKQLTDINWRFIAATHPGGVAGVLFYRHSAAPAGGEAYIEEFQLRRGFSGDTALFDQLFKKLDFDRDALSATFFVGRNVKLEKNKEILAAAGIKEGAAWEYERLGSLAEARGALRLRFFAGGA